MKRSSEKFYLIEVSKGIRTLQYLLNEQFKEVHLFHADDFEEIICTLNNIYHCEAYLVECKF